MSDRRLAPTLAMIVALLLVLPRREALGWARDLAAAARDLSPSGGNPQPDGTG